MFIFRSFFALLWLVTSARGAVYWSSDTYSGENFLDGFSFQAIPDPTHGRVDYVDQATALSQNLTYASGNHFVIRADHTSVLSADGPGRQSVRLQSNKQYTTHVSVWNIRHMPQGCATWPAVWEVGADWPNEGEIDILEGVNDQSPNQASFHTGPGCTMPAIRRQTGAEVGGNNCAAAETNNTGCGIKAPTVRSYGPAFNSAGGGFYAMERSNSGIKVWFWSRDDPRVPGEILIGSPIITPDSWGTPFAYFPSTDCDFDTHLGPHNLIINLTLCGDWAGDATVYEESGCPGDCISFVNENPSAFTDAYFDVESLSIYTPSPF